MATSRTPNTKATAPNATPAPETAPAKDAGGKGGPREAIALPTNLVVEAGGDEDKITHSRNRSKADNPFMQHVATGNANRGQTYRVPGITDERMANKVIGLLRAAGKTQGVSVITQYKPADERVLFEVKDKITRERKAK